MKTRRTKSAKLPNLNKLSTSRSSNRLSAMGNSSNMDTANSLFGSRKNVMVTYSKSRPLQFLKKSHFLSPDTPQTSTPNSLQLSLSAKKPEEDNKSKTLTTHMGTSLSLEDGHLTLPSSRITNIVRPVLALRDISNIPIEKTLTTVQCTPRRQQQDQTKDTQPETAKKLPKAKRKASRAGTKKRGKRLDMNKPSQANDASKKSKIASSVNKRLSDTAILTNNYGDNNEQEIQSYSTSLQKTLTPSKKSQIASKEENEQEEIIQEKQQQLLSVTMGKHQKQQILSKNSQQGQGTHNSAKCQSSMDKFVKRKTENMLSASSQLPRPSSIKKSPSQQSTNYSLKSMSTDTVTKTSNVISGQLNTLSDQSMSFCSMIEEEKEIKDNPCESAHQKNSTFNEDTNRVNLEDYFTLDLLSTIKEDPNIESNDKNQADTFYQESETIKDPDFTMKQQEEIAPKSSTPIDNGKGALVIEEPGISPITKDNDTPKINPINYQEVKETTKVHDDKEVNHSKKTSLKETTIKNSGRAKIKEKTKNTSLPLQASMCIEDDSESEDDNITPELMPPNKNQFSSSKRKLQYINTSMPFRPNSEECFLLDFPLTHKKPCMIWMKKRDIVKEPHSYVPDILTKVHVKKGRFNMNNYTH